jgi:hypothetical protein
VSGLALLALGGSQPAHALTINVSYPNASDVPAAEMTEINSVVSLLDSSFINPVTDNITVDFVPPGSGPGLCNLGCSSTTGATNITYGAWRGAMAADSVANPQNTFLSAAVATLPASDPIGNGNMSFVRTANGKAIGLFAFGGTDSALTFVNTPNTFEFTGVATASRIDFQNTFEHELDEALGIGSALTGLANNALNNPTSFEPEDYFRYSSTAGVRSITTSPTANVFFSYNGINDVQMFNQNNTACGNSTAAAMIGSTSPILAAQRRPPPTCRMRSGFQARWLLMAQAARSSSPSRRSAMILQSPYQLP